MVVIVAVVVDNSSYCMPEMSTASSPSRMSPIRPGCLTSVGKSPIASVCLLRTTPSTKTTSPWCTSTSAVVVVVVVEEKEEMEEMQEEEKAARCRRT